MRRRILLLGIAIAAVVLIPWGAYLAFTLPDRFVTRQWRVAWVGFDVALVVSFVGGVWLGLWRRRAAVPLLAVSAALLFCDAWFDVLLDWGTPDEPQSLLLAVLVEAPFGVLLLVWARRVIGGDVRPHRLMRRHLRLRGDPSFQRTAQALARPGPADLDATATPQLREGAALGLVRRTPDGSWALAARPEDPLRRDQEALAWAAEHRGEFGAWGYGQRVVAHLSAAEMARFATEYRELVSRYRLLHPAPTTATREVGIRCYAFPTPPADTPATAPAANDSGVAP